MKNVKWTVLLLIPLLVTIAAYYEGAQTARNEMRELCNEHFKRWVSRRFSDPHKNYVTDKTYMIYDCLLPLPPAYEQAIKDYRTGDMTELEVCQHRVVNLEQFNSHYQATRCVCVPYFTPNMGRDALNPETICRVGKQL